MTRDPMTPLELATAARVSCSLLEDQIERGHHRKAAETLRKLWDRIGAMASRIEEQQAEIERLRLAPAAPVPAPEVFIPEGGATPRRREMTARRPNPCAEVVLPEERRRPERKKGKVLRAQDLRNGKQIEMGPSWERVQRAYLDGRLRAGQTVGRGALHRLCGCNSVETLQMDLVIHRCPLRLVSHGNELLVRAA